MYVKSPENVYGPYLHLMVNKVSPRSSETDDGIFSKPPDKARVCTLQREIRQMTREHGGSHLGNSRLLVQKLYLIDETHEYLTLEQAQD